MKSKWDSLKNGNDIRGVAIENPEREVNLTEEIVSDIAKALVILLSGRKNKKPNKLKIAVGMDSRITGSRFKDIFMDGLSDSGCSVYDCGLCSTPAMFMSTVLEECRYDGAVEISASHLPYYYNGLKFFTSAGGFESSDVKELIEIAEKGEFLRQDNDGTICTVNLIDIYSNFLAKKIRDGIDDKEEGIRPLKGFKIIVDAGNGAGGFFAEKVLRQLGADISGSQFLEPDGTFPNHIPNPENEEAMESIRNAVLKNKADLGIIFDTDVDRAAIVDSKGNEINKNALIALISAVILEEHPGSVIVTDSVTSDGLKKFIEKHKGIHLRFKRGYKNVINEALRLNEEGAECHLAIETSGHAALKDNYFLDDGAYLVSKILVKMAKLKKEEGKSLSDLISDLEISQDEEYRIKINTEEFKAYGASILEDLLKYVKEVPGWSVEPVNYEGVRINCSHGAGNGWFLLRLSLHEPVMALNLESDTLEGLDMMLGKLRGFFSAHDKLGTLPERKLLPV